MGTRGPVRNRSEDLSRDRSRRGVLAGPEVTKAKGMAPAVIPDPSPDWDDITCMLWYSLHETGMKRFYQSTDWAAAYLLVDEIHAYRRRAPIMVKDPDTKKYVQKVDEETGELLFYPTHKLSGQMFQTLWSALGTLGVTEGDRRRMSIELTNADSDDGPDATVLQLVGDQFADLEG